MNKAKGHMFKSVGWTWNPVTGCTHGCGCSPENPEGYCFGRMLHMKYKRPGPFEKTHLNERTLAEKFPNDGTWIFVCSTGDLFCEGAPDDVVAKVLDRISERELNPGNRAYNTFLLQTKNPTRFFKFWPRLQALRDERRIVLGTTLETNRDVVGHAPPTKKRFEAMVELHQLGFRTFLSLEPLADFDYLPLLNRVLAIGPEAIEIGLENYTQILPQPGYGKIKDLVAALKRYGYTVVLKDNLQHLEDEDITEPLRGSVFKKEG